MPHPAITKLSTAGARRWEVIKMSLPASFRNQNNCYASAQNPRRSRSYEVVSYDRLPVISELYGGTERSRWLGRQFADCGFSAEAEALAAVQEKVVAAVNRAKEMLAKHPFLNRRPCRNQVSDRLPDT
jgi:hypothetical protein